jgi:uncharacterized membrane protein
MGLPEPINGVILSTTRIAHSRQPIASSPFEPQYYLRMNQTNLLAIGIGFVAGLRSLTPPAAVSWAARLGWLNLHGSPLAFMGSAVAVAIFSLLAALEYVADLLPRTPNRTKPGPLITRIFTGALSGVCLAVSAGDSSTVAAVLGGIGAVVGTFAGYQARTRLVSVLKVKDVFVAIPEDLVAIGLAYLMVSPR